LKPTARLDKWCVIRLGDGKKRFLGVVSGHKKLKDGEEIFTSEVIKEYQDGEEVIAPDAVPGTWWVETRNTVYTLGEPSSEIAVKYGLAAN